jgi:hypothetical protein
VEDACVAAPAALQRAWPQAGRPTLLSLSHTHTYARGFHPPSAAIWDTYKGIIEGANGATEYEEVERMAFYERAKKAFVIVSTGETAFYGVSAAALVDKGRRRLHRMHWHSLCTHTHTHMHTHTHTNTRCQLQNLILKKGIIGKAGE